MTGTEGRLLFIDDDTDLLEVNQKYFTAVGFKVDVAVSSEEALGIMENTHYDCIILDVRMEGTDGFEFCSNIRAKVETPVIFLTSLADEGALIKGFSCGADDYVVKPYHLKGLEARIRVRMNPRPKTVKPILKSGKLELNFSQKKASWDNTEVDLTLSEFEILYFLASHQGEPFTQEAIYEHLWGGEGFYNSHSIQTMILRIRKKLNAVSADQEFIRTQWGRGYVFTEQ